MKNLAKNVAIIGVTAIGLSLVWRFRGEFLLFFLAVILASVLAPLSEKLQHRGVPYPVSVLGVYGAAIAFFILMLVALAGSLFRDMTAFFSDCGDVYRHITENWPQGNLFERYVAEHIPSSKDLPEQLAQAANVSLMTQVLGIGGGILDLVVRMVLVVVIAIYWKLDYLRLERLWLFFLPLPYRKQARDVWRDVQSAAGEYLRDKFVLSFLTSLIFGMAAYWSNFPYPVATAVSIAILLLIPWLGPLLGLAAIWIASSVNFMDVTPLAGLIRSVSASVFALLLYLSLKWLVEPHLIEKKKYNSLLVFLVTLAMMYMMGFIALILGPPFAVAIQLIGSQFTNPQGTRVLAEEPRDLSALKQRWAERMTPRHHNETAHTPIFLQIVSRWESLLGDAMEKSDNGKN